MSKKISDLFEEAVQEVREQILQAAGQTELPEEDDSNKSEIFLLIYII